MEVNIRVLGSERNSLCVITVHRQTAGPFSIAPPLLTVTSSLGCSLVGHVYVLHIDHIKVFAVHICVYSLSSATYMYWGFPDVIAHTHYKPATKNTLFRGLYVIHTHGRSYD